MGRARDPGIKKARGGRSPQGDVEPGGGAISHPVPFNPDGLSHDEVEALKELRRAIRAADTADSRKENAVGRHVPLIVATWRRSRVRLRLARAALDQILLGDVGQYRDVETPEEAEGERQVG